MSSNVRVQGRAAGFSAERPLQRRVGGLGQLDTAHGLDGDFELWLLDNTSSEHHFLGVGLSGDLEIETRERPEDGLHAGEVVVLRDADVGVDDAVVGFVVPDVHERAIASEDTPCLEDRDAGAKTSNV